MCIKADMENRYPNNSVITDDRNLPSVMVYIPSFYLDEVIDNASHQLHPAFVVNGTEIKGIYISKFQNIVIDGRAYSLPSYDPQTNIDFDAAVKACVSKGNGFHLMTAMEWGAVALWCQKNGWLPYGNNDTGKDIREESIVAQITYSNEETQIIRVATGTGPVEWSHNRQSDGIFDLNGNVWEWSGGIRLVFGELQILANNDASDYLNTQDAASTAWRAIDGTTGELIYPDGYGTTANSIKLDYINNAWQYVTDTITSKACRARFSTFSEVKTHESICKRARELLYALGCLPCYDSGIDKEVCLFANNGAEERMLFRGGRSGQGLNAGIFKSCFDDHRTYTAAGVGFRSAYYEK